MAIETITPKEKQFGILKQTTWGTGATEGTSVIQVECPQFSINPDVKVRTFDASYGTRRPYVNQQINDTNASMPIISIPAHPAKQDLVDYFLYLFMQAVTEGDTTPFSKSLTIPNTQPDFSVNGGMFASVFERFPGASNSRKVNDCIGRSLTITCNPGEPLMVATELVGRGAVTENDNPAAAWTIPSNSFWYFEEIDRATMNFGSSINIRLQGIEIALSRTIQGYGNNGSGGPETVALVDYDLGFKLKIGEDLANTARQTIEAAYKAATVGTFRVGWGNATPGTTDGDLDFQWTGKLTNVVANADPILGIDIEGKMYTSDGTTTSPLTIVVANATDRTW